MGLPSLLVLQVLLLAVAKDPWRQLRSQRNAARDANRLDSHATPVDRVVIAAVLRLAPHDLAAKPELPGRAVLHARTRPLRLRIAERTRLQPRQQNDRADDIPLRGAPFARHARQLIPSDRQPSASHERSPWHSWGRTIGEIYVPLDR